MAAASPQELAVRFGAYVSLGGATTTPEGVCPLGWAELDELLPDGGFPRGVVELRTPCALGGATSIALSAIRAAQARDTKAWGAWIDPGRTLFAPGVAMADVDLSRLLVVRPLRERLVRTAIATARSAAFSVMVIDLDAAPPAMNAPSVRSNRAEKLDPFVRQLAILANEGGTTILLLTDANTVRPAPLPTALRLELSRTETTIEARVAKEYRGRVGLSKCIPFETRPQFRCVV